MADNVVIHECIIKTRTIVYLLLSEIIDMLARVG